MMGAPSDKDRADTLAGELRKASSAAYQWQSLSEHVVDQNRELKADRDRFFEIAKTLAMVLRPMRHFNLEERAEVTYSLHLPGDRLAEATQAIAELEKSLCLCGHQGPDRKGTHVGDEIPAPSKRLACTAPGCICKGFGTLGASVAFILDTRLGGP